MFLKNTISYFLFAKITIYLKVMLFNEEIISFLYNIYKKEDILNKYPLLNQYKFSFL